MRGFALSALILLSFFGQAQTEDMWRKLLTAEGLITASRNDTAIVILDRMLVSLDQDTPADRAFRLRVNLVRAQALTKQRKYPKATEELLRLIDQASVLQEYKIEAESALGMAYILQRQNSPEECLAYLKQAENLIKDHGLHELNARLWNRTAAYHYHYGDRDVALKLANRAVIVAREQNDSHQLALGHYIISLLKRKEDPRSSERHLANAAKYYRNTGSMSDYLVMTLAVNRLQMDGGRIREALVSNDSAMVYASRVEDRDSTYVSRVYDYRAELMKMMGEPDSAWYYLNMAHNSRVQHLKKVNDQRAVEIEARYKNEKNSQLIAEQERMLIEERDRRSTLMILIGFTTICLALLGYFYNRLRRAKTELEEQYLIEQENVELTQSLNKQKILQGEVHHRVKNNLQVIISLLELQMEDLSDPEARACLEAMSGRVFSMAAVHETLYQDGRGGEIDFCLYTEKICRHFDQLYGLPEGCEFDIQIKDYWFNLETAIPLGTVLNELLTNSFKYGVPETGEPLKISISMSTLEDQICLEYHDNGPGFPQGALTEREGGLGTYLLNGMSRQLRGRMESLNLNGALTRVFFKRKNQSALPSQKKNRRKRERVLNGTV